MRAIEHPQSNVKLTLPGGTEANDLHAQRFMAYDPALDETPSDAKPAFESHWAPDDDERARLSAGAPIVLQVHGEGHPPVAVGVAMIDTPPVIYEHAHVFRALGLLYAEIDNRIAQSTAALNAGAALNAETVGMPDPDSFIVAFEKALTETRELPADAPAGDETDPRTEADNDSGGGASA